MVTALQVHEESTRRNSTAARNTRSTLNKPFILFTQPIYATKVTKKLFSGSERDNTCWICGIPGHRFPKCRKPLDITAIAASKAEFMDKKYGKNGSKRTLFEVANGIAEMFDLENNGSDVMAATYFGMAEEEDTSSSESEESEVSEEKEISFTESTDTSDMSF